MFSLQTISHINHLIYVFGSSHINEKKNPNMIENVYH